MGERHLRPRADAYLAGSRHGHHRSPSPPPRAGGQLLAGAGAFHTETFPSIWSDTIWHSQVPERAEGLSRPDTFPYEGDGENTCFPHRAYREASGRSESELGAWRDRGPYPDKEVGEGRWLMALTADHGVIDLPEARAQAGEYGRRISPDERDAMVTRAEEAAEAAGTDPVERARAAAAAAMEEDWVEDAFAWEDLLAGAPADTLRALFVRSWHPERALGPLGHLLGIPTPDVLDGEVVLR